MTDDETSTTIDTSPIVRVCKLKWRLGIEHGYK